MTKEETQKVKQLILELCPLRGKFIDDREKYYCRPKWEKKCKLLDIAFETPNSLGCPVNCPKHPYQNIECDGTSCKFVTKKLKELKN